MRLLVGVVRLFALLAFGAVDVNKAVGRPVVAVLGDGFVGYRFAYSAIPGFPVSRYSERLTAYVLWPSTRTTLDSSMERAPIEVRVDQAAALLKESQALVDDVAEELRIRGEELERLAKETARQQQLAEISKEGAEAIEALVSNRIREENSRMEKRTTRQQWIFLIVGTVCLGGLVSLIIELATS